MVAASAYTRLLLGRGQTNKVMLLVDNLRRSALLVDRPFSSNAPSSKRNLSSIQSQRDEYLNGAGFAFRPDDPLLERVLTEKEGRKSEHQSGQFEMKSHSLSNEKLDSPSELTYTGNEVFPITSQLHIVTPEEDTPTGKWPVFRLMDEDGMFRSRPSLASSSHKERARLEDLANQFPDLQLQTNPLLVAQEFFDMATNMPLLRSHTLMIRLREMDRILHSAQRQGRISFYMTCRGEEAIHFGAASALDLQDVVLAQYREAGLLMWRGFTLQQFADQCFTNESDLSKGRQMPIHYGSRALNYQTISSPLGTQLPQAVGAAYRLKLQEKQNVSIVFFGEGCASTVDFHSACNFASTLKVPVIFLCRNNGYAISTPANEQYAGDGIISRCKGYGMAGIRVDGNDIFAVAAAVGQARKYALEKSAPVMIEAMTYRQGHHSTSDDSTRYRDAKEVQDHQSRSDPLLRLNKFLHHSDIVDEGTVAAIVASEKQDVLEAMESAEAKGQTPVEGLFHDVYHTMPSILKKQENQLNKYLSKFPSSRK